MDYLIVFVKFVWLKLIRLTVITSTI